MVDANKKYQGGHLWLLLGEFTLAEFSRYTNEPYPIEGTDPGTKLTGFEQDSGVRIDNLGFFSTGYFEPGSPVSALTGVRLFEEPVTEKVVADCLAHGIEKITGFLFFANSDPNSEAPPQPFTVRNGLVYVGECDVLVSNEDFPPFSPPTL